MTSRRAGLFLLGLALVAQGAWAQESAASYKTEAETFRTNRAQSLTAPDGWFSLVGLEWLKPGANTVGAAADNSVRLFPDRQAPGMPAHLAVLEQEGVSANAELRIAPPAGGWPTGFTIGGQPAQAEALNRNSKLQVGTYTILVLERGDRLGLRIKDTNAPGRAHFTGLKWYPVDEKYRVTAKWVPYPEEHTVEIGTVIGTVLHEKIPGYAEFRLNGQDVRIEPIVEGKKLFFILRDKTSLTTTYGASRFLYADLPSAGLTKEGTVVLDLNKLENPPCAYTEYATCPLPPAGNRLSVAIPAGEKRYHE